MLAFNQHPVACRAIRSLGNALLAAVCCLAPLAAAQAQVTLTEVTRYNLGGITSGTNTDGSINNRYVGNSVNSVAWNGSRLFVAGFVNHTSDASFDNEGIIEITNTATTGVVSSGNVQYGNRFGFYPGIGQRGYTGLELSGNRLVAALDLGADGVGFVPGMAGYDISTATPTQTWALNNVRGSVNPANDPGYVVSGSSLGGSGVAWGTFGTGSTSRGLLNPATGASIYGFTSGSVPVGLEWWTSPAMPGSPRALSFDPDTGDVYGRTGNWVTKAVRTGTNSASAPVAIWNTFSSDDRTLGQNLAFMSNTTNGDLVVFNGRDSASYPQTFVQSVGVIDSNGGTQSVSWNFLTGTVSGYDTVQRTGWYDFAFDPATQTLAVAQPQEYRVSIFKLGAPDPSTQLRWAPTDGYVLGGDGTWANSPATVWNGAYGPEAWSSGAQAYFGGTAFPTSTITVDAGGVSVGRGMSFVANGYTIAGGSIALTGSTGSVNNLYVDPGVTATVNSSIAATNGLAKSGGGTLVIGGTVTGGNLSINNGTVAVAPTGVIRSSPGISVLASGTLDVTQLAGGYVVPGGQSLAGAGLVSGSVTMSSGATLSPGSNLGTLTITNDLTLNGGGNYNWQITSGSGSAGTSWDLARIGGALSIASSSTSPFKVNLWSLSGTSPDVNGNATNFDSTQNYSWTIVTATGGISGFAANKFLINTSGTNGTTGFSNAFGNGTFSLAQSGNDLNLVFTAGGPTVITINVASGTQTQSQAGYPTLSGSIPVFKTGAGTLVVNQANTLTGSTTVQGGRLQLANGAALASSQLVPVAGGTVTLTPGLQTTVGGLAANAGGLTDVGSGMVTVAAGLSAPNMVAAIVTGLGDGTWNGTSGITSSVAAASGGDRTVGWLDNGDGSVTFAFAAAGDTNLDWQVDIIDAANFLAGGKFDSGTPASWNEGDFTYDGVVDILDAASFLSNGLFDAGPYNSAPGAAGNVSAVPEPSGLAWVAAAAGLLVAGFRQRRQEA